MDGHPNGETLLGVKDLRISFSTYAGEVQAMRGGEILFDGRDILKLSEKQMQSVRGQRIAMVFQDPMTSLDPTMRIGRQITESLKKHLGMSGRRAGERALELLK